MADKFILALSFIYKKNLFTTKICQVLFPDALQQVTSEFTQLNLI